MSFLITFALQAWADCPQDDSYEDNDSAQEAADLNSNAESNLYVCDSDEDWFWVSGTEGELLTIDAIFSHVDGDIDLKLYATNDWENPLSSAVTVSDNETLSYMVETSGSYYLQVFYFSAVNTGSNRYDLSVTSGTAPDFLSDPY